MAIKTEFEVDHDLLIVTASGEDDSLEEVQAYARKIIETAIENNCSKIICDERNLIYLLSVSDTYELAKDTAFVAPKIAHTAIITLPEYKEIVEFWEMVALNRGLSIKVFYDKASALKWLR